MSNWWYIHKNKKKGPFTDDDVKGLFLSGKLSDNTQMWQEGMDEWMSLKDISDLDHLKTLQPPPIPEKESPPQDYRRAGAGKRFFARAFDLWLEGIILFFIVLLLPDNLFFFLGEWIYKEISTGYLVATLIFTPFLFLLDALIYRIFGNTPGKALLRVKVTTNSGTTLNFWSYYVRNLFCWAGGMALNIPIVAMFAAGYQAYRLGKGQRASYDEDNQYNVLSLQAGWVRVSIFTVLFTALLVGLATLNVLGEKVLDSIPSSTNSSQQYSKPEPIAVHDFSKLDTYWTNPVTDQLTTLPGYWEDAPIFHDAPYRPFYEFKSDNGDGVVLLSVIEKPKLRLMEEINFTLASLSAEYEFDGPTDDLYNQQLLTINDKTHDYSIYRTASKKGENTAPETLTVFITEVDGIQWRLFRIFNPDSSSAEQASELLEKRVVSTINGGQESLSKAKPTD